mgnify:CR=1 FL=1
MKIAFYCRVDGQGFGFVLPDEADKLREFFAEHQDKPALEKPSSASKIFCRELDIRVAQVVKTHLRQPCPLWPGVKFCVSAFRQSQEWRWKAGRILA